MDKIASFHDLRGASVFITGGGSGIGAALTEGFLQQGAKVAFVGRSDYTDFADRLGHAYENRPMNLRCDVTDTAALHEAMDTAAAANGAFDVLVNDAANDQRMEAATVDVGTWDEMLAVNLRHYFFSCQKAYPMMKAKGGGSIINFSSITYMQGAAGLAPYVVSNGGITALTRALAREWGPDGIRVNAVAPGWVLTDRQMDKWATDEKLEAFKKLQCLKEFMKPEDMVGTVLFLASGVSRMLTSQVIPVDAGVVVTG